jgi:tetratricopeptide (TPR) repeat protein
MKQTWMIAVLLSLSLAAAGQKSKVIAVMQMIEAEKYEEAKEDIEEAVENDRTSKWPRTYYAKGLLCQTAYEAGVKKKDAKGTNLYPDQLFVAFDSYEKALELDARGRLHSAIGKQYYLLANDLIRLGEARYNKQDYPAALHAFDYALRISESDFVSVKSDTNLIYNTAMAAYESKNYSKAIPYLKELDEGAYDPSVSLLLAIAYRETGDTLQSGYTLMEGMETYRYEDTLVMFTVNQLVGAGRPDSATRILKRAIQFRPDHSRYYWALARVQQTMGRSEEALINFQKAIELNPGNPEIYYETGMCYYNMGIELRQSAQLIPSKEAYQEIRKKYLELLRKSVEWLEKSYALDPGNERTVTRLYELYNHLQMKEAQKTLEPLLN